MIVCSTVVQHVIIGGSVHDQGVYLARLAVIQRSGVVVRAGNGSDRGESLRSLACQRESHAATVGKPAGENAGSINLVLGLHLVQDGLDECHILTSAAGCVLGALPCLGVALGVDQDGFLTSGDIKICIVTIHTGRVLPTRETEDHWVSAVRIHVARGFNEVLAITLASHVYGIPGEWLRRVREVGDLRKLGKLPQ